MKQIAWTLALALPMVGASAADADWARCRALAEASTRLACYDTIPLAPPMVAGAPKSSADAFGLPVPTPALEAQTLQSTVGPTFDGWEPNQHIRLDNGQVWQVTDGSSITVPARSRKVSVRRGMLGSFYLDIEGLNASPRVRRVQ